MKIQYLQCGTDICYDCCGETCPCGKPECMEVLEVSFLKTRIQALEMKVNNMSMEHKHLKRVQDEHKKCLRNAVHVHPIAVPINNTAPSKKKKRADKSAAIDLCVGDDDVPSYLPPPDSE